MNQRKLMLAHGNWVDGDRFWGRETDLALFAENIDAGAHQLLIAQRRMGKTSLMKETARQLQSRYAAVFVDLQKCSDSPDAIVALSLATRPHQSIWNKLRTKFGGTFDWFRSNVESIDLGEVGVKLRADITGEWRQRGDDLMGVLADSDTPVLLLIDELPILINRMLKGADYNITPERRQQADLFLSWLRDNSIRHQGKIRMVLSGSIGLEPILRQGRLSATLNNFAPFELKPWDEETARGCLEALAANYGLAFEEGVSRKMVEKLGCCIPHHVQMFFRHARDWCARGRKKEISKKDVKAIYERELLSIHGHAELTHYEERLKMVLGDDIFPLALEVLTEAAVVGHVSSEAMSILSQGHELCSMTAPEAQREILDILEHDGYLERKGGRYRFVSKLLADWWKARHEFAYIPVSKRETRQ